jgi:predicted aspartyl protease
MTVITVNTVSTDDQELNLSLNMHDYWRKWKRKIQKLLCRTSTGPLSKSLVIPVMVEDVSGDKRQLSALIDTGAAVPVVVKKGLFDSKLLQGSICPVKFVTASGQELTGGTTGLKLQLKFSVRDTETGMAKNVSCEPIWAYEADLHATDLILGYPFLQGFGLIVDTVENCLSLKPVKTVDIIDHPGKTVLSNCVKKEKEVRQAKTLVEERKMKTTKCPELSIDHWKDFIKLTVLQVLQAWMSFGLLQPVLVKEKKGCLTGKEALQQVCQDPGCCCQELSPDCKPETWTKQEEVLLLQEAKEKKELVFSPFTGSRGGVSYCSGDYWLSERTV